MKYLVLKWQWHRGKKSVFGIQVFEQLVKAEEYVKRLKEMKDDTKTQIIPKLAATEIYQLLKKFENEEFD
jgi:Mg/Co/Ni transporter MgtE